ncbi:MAG TPA: RluA family pseudouridine synthase [Ktedonobacterales bacterium]
MTASDDARTASAYAAEPLRSAPARVGTPISPVILYEDVHLLAVDKPARLVTHPAYRHPDGTLCDAVFARQAARGEGRPWLLHRLDRDTSGVVLFAKTEVARRAVVRQFEQRTIHKRYLALTAGVPIAPVGMIEAPLRRDPADRRRSIVDANGAYAATRYTVLAHAGDYALVLAEPLTGRTHQIRAHLAHLGAPLVGDVRYLAVGHPAASLAEGAMLHAWQLHLRYPGSGELWSISAPLPPALLALAASLALPADESALHARISELTNVKTNVLP